MPSPTTSPIPDKKDDDLSIGITVGIAVAAGIVAFVMVVVMLCIVRLVFCLSVAEHTVYAPRIKFMMMVDIMSTQILYY